MLDATALDADVATLRASAGEWATMPLAAKRRLLEAVRGATAAVAEEWVRLCCQGKGIATGCPAAGEEWMSGPYALLPSAAARSAATSASRAAVSSSSVLSMARRGLPR